MFLRAGGPPPSSWQDTQAFLLPLQLLLPCHPAASLSSGLLPPPHTLPAPPPWLPQLQPCLYLDSKTASLLLKFRVQSELPAQPAGLPLDSRGPFRSAGLTGGHRLFLDPVLPPVLQSTEARFGFGAPWTLIGNLFVNTWWHLPPSLLPPLISFVDNCLASGSPPLTPNQSVISRRSEFVNHTSQHGSGGPARGRTSINMCALILKGLLLGFSSIFQEEPPRGVGGGVRPRDLEFCPCSVTKSYHLPLSLSFQTVRWSLREWIPSQGGEA